MSRRLDVAVGVLQRGDTVFVQQRPEGSDCAGQWEFPGGKQEQDEAIEAALSRELYEELGIHVLAQQPLLKLEYDYPHALVRLHVFCVSQWLGEPASREGQIIAWHAASHLKKLPMLAASQPIVNALLSV